MDGYNRGVRSEGDTIPWLVIQQLQEDKFGLLNGERVVGIATHKDRVSFLVLCLGVDWLGWFQMGYGSRRFQTLNSFYSGEYFSFDETSRPEPSSYPDAATIDKAFPIIFP